MSRSTSKTRLSATGSRSSLKDRGRKKEEEEEDGGVEEEAQLAWQVLGEAKTRELASMEEVEVARALASVLSLTQCEESMSEAALLDYYVAAYWFAREHQFSEEQTSTLFTIMHVMMENLKDKHLSLSENIQELQRLLTGVGVSQQTAVRCLTPQAATLVVKCVTTSLFQHYRLFQCLFEEEQEEHQLDMQLAVELPPPPATLIPPPLDEAVPLELYQKYMAPKSTFQGEDVLQKEEKEEVPPEVMNLTQEESEVLMKVSPEDLKSLMESLASDTLSSYQAEVMKKMKEKEQALMNRLSKLEKSLT